MEKVVEIKPFRPKTARIDSKQSGSRESSLSICPGCREPLRVTELSCPTCKVSIRGEFNAGPFQSLSAEDQAFLMEFVLCEGSLKGLGKTLALSYPTVRKRLDAVRARLEAASIPVRAQKDRRQRVLDLLEKRQITVEAAEEILNKLL